MIRSLVIRPLAERDIEAAAGWYEDQRERLGGEFLDALGRCMTRILERPESFPVVHRVFRRALVERFPYLVIFSVAGDVVVVTAVVHGARRPATWKARQ